MSRCQIKTNNSFLESKIVLRMKLIENISLVSVLDCYAGDSKIWNEIKKRSKKNISVLPIDIRSDYKGVYLQGDNIKYLSSMDLNKFNVIDLDAYGIPFKQLKILFLKNYKGLIFVTFIKSMFGRIPYGLLQEIGYPKKFIKKCPSLFNINGFEKFKEYLYLNGIKKIYSVNYNRKYYIGFFIN